MVDFFQPHGPEREGRFPERKEGESEENWQNRINEGWGIPRLVHQRDNPPPPPRRPRLPTPPSFPYWKPLSYAAAGLAGAGIMWVNNRLSTPPTLTQPAPIAEVRSPIQLTIASSIEPIFTTPELVKAASRVAEMEQFLKNVLIWPDIRINTSGVGALNEEELNKLLLNANVGERVAKWEFDDPAGTYNLAVTYTYENDGRLSQKFLRLGLANRTAEPTKSYLDSSGLIRTDYLDSVRKSVLRESRVISFGPNTVNYNDGSTAPAKRGLAIDAITGARIEIVNDNRGLVRMWETETFYTDPS